MSERKDKSPEQVSDEDYKIAPTSADEAFVREDAKSRNRERTTEQKSKLPESVVQKELKEGVE